MSSECLFCRLAADPGLKTRYRSEHVVAFDDIEPKATVHVLVIPIQHVESVREVTDAELLGQLFEAARTVATEAGLDAGGYRLVFNVGPDAGQTVLHAHLHLLGGRRFSWPPG